MKTSKILTTSSLLLFLVTLLSFTEGYHEELLREVIVIGIPGGPIGEITIIGMDPHSDSRTEVRINGYQLKGNRKWDRKKELVRTEYIIRDLSIPERILVLYYKPGTGAVSGKFGIITPITGERKWIGRSFHITKVRPL